MMDLIRHPGFLVFSVLVAVGAVVWMVMQTTEHRPARSGGDAWDGDLGPSCDGGGDGD